jgi:hypothetical protein
MNVRLHQRAKRSIDHPMALDGPLARKTTRENPYVEMAAAVTRSGVSDVAMAIVDDLELFRLELCFELASNQRYALSGHGAT